MIRIDEKIKLDLVFLQHSKNQNFKNISFEEIERIAKNKKEFKKDLKGTQLYSSFKCLWSELRWHKMPFRIIKTIKQRHPTPSYLKEALEVLPTNREERKKLLNNFIEKCTPHINILKVVEQLHWIHGTNSALLPCLKGSNYTLLSSGKLLDEGIAPFCGELDMGGMKVNGCNQNWISVETIRNVNRSWMYASSTSHSFKPEKFSNAEAFFCEHLKKFEQISASSNDWDNPIIALLQLKQWDPETFEKLQKKYEKEINETLLATTQKLFYKEGLILKALNYSEEELKKAITDIPSRKNIENQFLETLNEWKDVWSEELSDDAGGPFCYFLSFANPQTLFKSFHFIDNGHWKKILVNVFRLRIYGDKYLDFLKNPAWGIARIISARLKELYGESPNISQFLQNYITDRIDQRIQEMGFSLSKRLLRLKNVFDSKPKIKLSEEQKQLITTPFPILLGSTKTKGFFLNGTDEAHVPSAKFAEEVDTIFVLNNDLSRMNSWLKEENLDDKMCVHSWEALAQVPIPLYHTADDVIGENLSLSESDYTFIHKNIQHLLPPYQEKGFEHHGIPHATRAAFFAAIITEMYLTKEQHTTANPRYLPIAGFVHDRGRENDFGEDLWDKESGDICYEFMTTKLNLSSEEAEILSKGISEKDKEHFPSLEQKIIHDADCIEFIRCLQKNTQAFESERLWIFKDKFAQPLLDLFINEAKTLITLTEIPLIKKHFQEVKDPWCFLMQIIHTTAAFPFLKTYTFNSVKLFNSNFDNLLTPEVEKTMDAFLKETK